MYTTTTYIHEINSQSIWEHGLTCAFKSGNLAQDCRAGVGTKCGGDRTVSAHQIQRAFGDFTGDIQILDYNMVGFAGMRACTKFQHTGRRTIEYAILLNENVIFNGSCWIKIIRCDAFITKAECAPAPLSLFTIV